MTLETDIREQFSPVAERLAREYEAGVRRAYNRFNEAPAESRQSIMSGRLPQGMSRLEADRFSSAYRSCRRYVRLEGGRLSGEPSLAEDFLVKEADRYGEEQANAFLGKLMRKLDGAHDPELIFSSAGGANFTLKLHAGEDNITVNQQTVMKVNQQGTFYHQFPARLALNGKPITEKALRERLDAMNANNYFQP